MFTTPYDIRHEQLYPRFMRLRSPRVIAGVSSGLALHLGIEVAWVRLAFVIATLLSGIGAILYAVLWMVTPVTDVEEASIGKQWPTPVYWLLIIPALVLPTSWGSVSVKVILPLCVVGLGAFLAWRAYDYKKASGWSRLALVSGIVLVIGGVAVAIVLWDTGGMGGSLIAVVLTLAGVIVLAGPAVARLWEAMLSSREETAVAEQRAEIASRLHDSVLQTLALIQKRADNPEEVTRLARSQERELRGWLFEPKEETLTLKAALERAAGEVEDMFAVKIPVVTVGEDEQLTENTHALVLAAREAMVNAAKHSGETQIDVYLEISAPTYIFIRDRGVGFDTESIPEDRHGITNSILARMETIGGTATIRSAPNEGTEVILELP